MHLTYNTQEVRCIQAANERQYDGPGNETDLGFFSKFAAKFSDLGRAMMDSKHKV